MEMADPELEAIRKQRLAQLQSQYKGDGSGENSQKPNEEQIKAQEDMKNSILAQILDQTARGRLNTLKMAKPERGNMVEEMLVRMAKTGQICTKIGDKELVSMLENISNQTQSKTTVKFDRRRAAIDSDDDL
ncbi:programmed Cell Death 5 [Leptinotarsa decemlineata]|uniref:programmed Cell Death 5 n=1 Tax=Leptinotarsa decemlineata TaxID=7539 RepID=UPI000C25240C|nr:programmed cell death protein 5 [Leptinotarsa decemlineata]